MASQNSQVPLTGIRQISYWGRIAQKAPLPATGTHYLTEMLTPLNYCCLCCIGYSKYS
jgi:hypothetical protein